jgi:hypothetical protein
MVRVQFAGLLLACPWLVLGWLGCVPRNAVVASPTVELTVRDAVARPLEEAESDPGDDGRAAGDLVEVEWRGAWWPAVLLEKRRSGWQVHYEGYSKEWDEVASLDRIRDRGVRVDEPSLEPMDEDVDP